MKGKGKAKVDEASPAEQSKSSGHSGRTPGAQNYTTRELTKWLKILKTLLPIAPDDWEICAEFYNRWAANVGRPERNARALRTKFEQVWNSVSCTDFIS